MMWTMPGVDPVHIGHLRRAMASALYGRPIHLPLYLEVRVPFVRWPAVAAVGLGLLVALTVVGVMR